MLQILGIIITAIFVNNIVFAQFLGICPFIGVSKRFDSAVGMGCAVTFVMAIATAITWLLQYFVLVPLGLQFVQTILFILVIAVIVQMIEIVMRKISPSLHAADHHQLRRPGRCHSCHPQILYICRFARLCHIHGARLYDGFADIFGHPHTARYG